MISEGFSFLIAPLSYSKSGYINKQKSNASKNFTVPPIFINLQNKRFLLPATIKHNERKHSLLRSNMNRLLLAGKEGNGVQGVRKSKCVI